MFQAGGMKAQPAWPSHPQVPTAVSNIHRVAAQGPFQPDWRSLTNYTVPEWYLNAKLGIFIHWGVYSVPAFGSEHYPRLMYTTNSPTYKHHVETWRHPSQFGYKDFIPMFRAEKFDPAAWAKLLKQSGAKYVVPVAEHHDGFPMYECSFTRWDASKMGPRRDIIGELATALRREGLVVGASSHRIEHWFFLHGGTQFHSDVNDPAYADFYGPAQSMDTPLTTAYMDDWLARTCEIVDKYRPQVLWFDWWIEQPAMEPYRKALAAYYYNRAAQWKRGVVINFKNRAFPPGAAVFDLERGQMDRIKPFFWQNDTSLSKVSWGWVTNQQWKTSTSLIHDLVDLVSKNGCLLLNIGPKPDGTIPEQEQRLLLEMGEWLRVNGKAIYGTRPWQVFGEGPTLVAKGAMADTKRGQFTAEDFRFTQGKDGSLYAIALGWPENGRLVIRSLAEDGAAGSRGKVTNVRLLGSQSGVEWTRTGQGLEVKLPIRKPGDHAFVLQVSGRNLQPAPQAIARPVVQASPDGVIVLNATTVELHGTKMDLELRAGQSNISYWEDPAEYVTWLVKFPAARTYHVRGDFSSPHGSTDVSIEAAGQKVTLPTTPTRDWEDYNATQVVRLNITEPAQQVITVRAQSAKNWRAISLRSLTLSPAIEPRPSK